MVPPDLLSPAERLDARIKSGHDRGLLWEERSAGLHLSRGCPAPSIAGVR